MITYKDIKIAVNGLLSRQFEVDINSNNVKEGFLRPSFFVFLDNQNRSSNVDQVEKSLTIRIHYFPADRYDYSMELLDVQERLGDLFDLKLPVKDRKFNIIEADSTETDGVLVFSFEIEFSEGREIEYGANPNTELMQKLDIKKGLN